jgi:hypothetical protein
VILIVLAILVVGLVLIVCIALVVGLVLTVCVAFVVGLVLGLVLGVLVVYVGLLFRARLRSARHGGGGS